jgi:hypothetical protein
VSKSFADRVAHNESIFRSINDRIEAGASPRPVEEPVVFLCECARLRCSDMVELTFPEYEAVRADPHRFVLVAGHELADVEVVVDTKPGYIVVEKVGEAGRAAAREANPRRR